jgi:metal transporter CNNM
MSGLTVGLLSLDHMNLQILSHSGDAKQKKYSSGILPILKNRHHLMVTLLLMNAMAMEALPIFLDKLSDPVIAIAISVTAVLLFGE